MPDEQTIERDWEQLEGETPKAFAAFLGYLEMGYDRSIAKAFKAHTGSKSRHPGRYFKDWAVENRWVERADAFDSFELGVRIETRETARELSRQVMIDGAVSVSKKLLRVAGGELEVSREQLNAMKDILDRAGLAAPKKSKFDLGSDSGPASITVKIGGGDGD